jgi:hypothetical protein
VWWRPERRAEGQRSPTNFEETIRHTLVVDRLLSEKLSAQWEQIVVQYLSFFHAVDNALCLAGISVTVRDLRSTPPK